MLLVALAFLTQNVAADDDVKCGIYLAPSTIPGAGLGMFAGRSYKAAERLGGDIVIPVADYDLHNPHLSKHEVDYFFNSYGWNCEAFQGLMHDNSVCTAWTPGTGAALNCDLPLVNVYARDDLIETDTVSLHRSKDPGVGAFTPFHNRVNVAYRDIRAGEELYDSYGDHYFAAREDLYGKLPLTSDYGEADNLLRVYTALKAQLCEEHPLERANDAVSQDWYSLMADMASIWPSRILNALPKDVKDLGEVMAGGTAWTNYNRSIHAVDWLDENGECMDHVEARPSTIEQAGRGAFAKRFLPKGSVVGPAPVVHLLREEMNVRPLYFADNGEYAVDPRSPTVHQQLALNYCFGHRHSSLLLCNYGMINNLINHSREKANAKLEWNFKLMQHPEWLDQPFKDWITILKAGLMLNFVATRDIQPGEEVFLDYGPEWEAAWQRHVSEWRPAKHATRYRPARELNMRETIMTMAEGHYQEEDVTMYCLEWYRTWSGLPEEDERVQGISGFRVHKGTTSNLGMFSHFCRVIDRYQGSEGETLYTVELYSQEESKDGDKCEILVYEVLLAVPRDAIFFEDVPYSRE